MIGTVPIEYLYKNSRTGTAPCYVKITDTIKQEYKI